MLEDNSRLMKSFLKRWLITTLSVMIAAKLLSGISYTNEGLIIAALLLGILNAFVRPIMLLLSLPLLVFSLGLFVLVINAILFYWVGQLKDFHVDSFKTAFWGALITSIVTMILNTMTGSGNARIKFQRGGPQPPKPPKDDGGGPVIDV